MNECVQFISDQEQFKDAISSLLKNPAHREIFISGIWGKFIYRDIINKIIDNNYSDRCRIIIHHITDDKGIRNPHINQICKLGGKVRVNSKFSNCIVIIGDNVFIVSFTYKYDKEQGLKINFGCSMYTNHDETLKEIKEVLNHEWDRSFPLTVEGVQEVIV